MSKIYFFLKSPQVPFNSQRYATLNLTPEAQTFVPFRSTITCSHLTLDALVTTIVAITTSVHTASRDYSQLYHRRLKCGYICANKSSLKRVCCLSKMYPIIQEAHGPWRSA